MSIALAPAVTSAHEKGEWADAYLIRFDLPGKTVGYVAGPRPQTFNGLIYQPNRYLSKLRSASYLGFSASSKSVKFSNVPTDNVDDAVASIEQYDYQNAPVVVSTLLLDPQTGEVNGVAESSIHEVADVEFTKGPMDAQGKRELTTSIVLDDPNRAVREQTGVKRSLKEQQFDNDPTDYGHRHTATSGEWTRRHGRI